MITVGHTSDWHLTDDHRFEDVLRVLEWVLVDGKKRGVNLWLIPADFNGHTVPYRPNAKERNAIDDLIIYAAETAPVVIAWGNHDPLSELDRLRKLRAKHPIFVCDRPEIIELGLYDADLTATVFALPYPQKRFLTASGTAGDDASVLGTKQVYEDGIRAILGEWRIRAKEFRDRGYATIGTAHINVAGSKVGGDEVMIGQEIEVSPHDLDEVGLDYWGLGHIHKHQQVAQHAFFCGTPAPQNHGEEAYTCGYIVAEVEAGKPHRVHFMPTPARRLLTLEARWAPSAAAQYQWEGLGELDVQDAEVRLRYTVEEDRAATCPVDELVESIKGAGAHSVVKDPKIIPKVRIRSDEISRAQTPIEKLRAYWTSIGKEAPSPEQQERCATKVEELEREVA